MLGRPGSSGAHGNNPHPARWRGVRFQFERQEVIDLPPTFFTRSKSNILLESKEDLLPIRELQPRAIQPPTSTPEP